MNNTKQYLQAILRKALFAVSLFYLYFFLGCAEFRAQTPNYFTLSEKKLSAKDSSRTAFAFKNLNFFRNNEYFNPFYEGYSLLGYFLRPELIWNPLDKFVLRGGIHAQKYSGISQFTEVLPTFSAIYSPSENSEIRLGTLDNVFNHRAEDLILFSESYLTKNVENGIQIKHKSLRFSTDIWLNWEQFIFHGSDYPEKFTFGTVNNFKINPQGPKHLLSIDFQSVITHRGGQVNDNKQPILSVANFVFGLKDNFRSGKILWELKARYITFTDISPTKNLPYLSGYAVVSGFSCSYQNFDFALSHFYGKFFISSRGNPLYMSVSTDNPNYKEPLRAMLTGHAVYSKTIYDETKIGLAFDGYFDLYNKTLDYIYSIYLSYNFFTPLRKKH